MLTTESTEYREKIQLTVFIYILHKSVFNYFLRCYDNSCVSFLDL